MVLTRGGYRFSDFGGLGGLLTLVVGITACCVLYALPHDMLPAITAAGNASSVSAPASR